MHFVIFILKKIQNEPNLHIPQPSLYHLLHVKRTKLQSVGWTCQISDTELYEYSNFQTKGNNWVNWDPLENPWQQNSFFWRRTLLTVSTF